MPVEQKPPRTIVDMRADLTAWYRRTARHLPWRAPPDAALRTPAYRVWLSEVMLQQTTVAAVIPYFDRFTARWPTLTELAAADADAVLAAWAGLGYYSRARNLIACAHAVVDRHGGVLPAEPALLRALPGIGDYSAAAIAAIAYGADTVPVDANIERVVARLFAIARPLPAARREIAQAATALFPGSGGNGDFAQALMDLGATVCTARAPACLSCPIAAHCLGRQQGIAPDLPVKAPRAVRPERYGRALWIERRTGSAPAVWLVRRPATGLLGGMRALPGGDWGSQPAPAPAGTRTAGTVRHVFTHFVLHLTIDVADDPARADGEGDWWPLARLDAAGLPTLYRHAARLLHKD